MSINTGRGKTMISNAYMQGSGKILIILLTMDKGFEVAGLMFDKIKDVLPDAEITLAVFESSDWDNDFSPWKFEMENGRSFAGNGKVTLEKIKKFINGKYSKVFLAGYSLAGLFSLWAVHETDLFDGCACCSGSLWFDGWEDYSKSHAIKKPGTVYLSVGGKEDKAKDPVVAAVVEKTRGEDRRLKNDPNVLKHTLVMNPGGHFSNPDKRLIQGITWLLQA